MKGIVTGILGLVAATGVSLCCLGPLIFGALGLGAFGAGAFFGAWRPYLMALTFGLLGGALYVTYRKTPGEACCEADLKVFYRRQRRQKITLWVIAVAALALVSLPYVV